MLLAASLPANAIPGLNLNETVGALLIGGLVSAVLYGITMTQAVVYYQRSDSDSLPVKLVVFILWALDTFDMILIGHVLYWFLVVNYDNPLALQSPVWSIVLHVTVTAVTEAIVRCMFTIRIVRLSNGNWVFASLIAAVTLLDLICSIIIPAKAWNTTFAGLKKINIYVYLEFVSQFAGDVLVALSLCYLLHRSRTGIRRTDSMINVLIAYVVNTGLLTALASSVSIVLFATRSDNFVYIAVFLQVSKLYVNAYLVMLNARQGLRERSTGAVSIHLSRLPTHHEGSNQPTTLSQSTRPYSKAGSTETAV